MIVYGEWIWEGLSTETKPLPPTALPGHVFKELDTGESYTLRLVGGTPTWEYINLGLSFIKATKSGKVTTDGAGFYHVVFVTPFIDANYSIQLSAQYEGKKTSVIAYFDNLTANGFDIRSFDSKGDASGAHAISWLATRDYNP